MNGPAGDAGSRAEGRRSDRRSETHREVSSLPEFRQWLDSLPQVVVDDVRYYVRGGDMLKDSDEVLWEWARKNRPDLMPPD